MSLQVSATDTNPQPVESYRTDAESQEGIKTNKVESDAPPYYYILGIPDTTCTSFVLVSLPNKNLSMKACTSGN